SSDVPLNSSTQPSRFSSADSSLATASFMALPAATVPLATPTAAAPMVLPTSAAALPVSFAASLMALPASFDCSFAFAGCDSWAPSPATPADSTRASVVCIRVCVFIRVSDGRPGGPSLPRAGQLGERSLPVHGPADALDEMGLEPRVVPHFLAMTEGRVEAAALAVR